MAYNPNLYLPYTVQPNQSWTPVQNTTQTLQPFNGLIRVNGNEGAKAFQLPPNSSVALFDENEDILYIKKTDGAGFPTIDPYSFEPLKPAVPVEAEYVSREEFEDLKRRVNNIQPGSKPRNNSNKKGHSNGEQSVSSTTEY